MMHPDDARDEPSPPHIGPIQEEAARRERFTSNELAVVLSHYDLGVIHGIHEYPRGSSRAPKVRIRCDRGEFLLKRRAPGRDLPHRVAFCHHMLLHLVKKDFPTARLIGTRADNNSMLSLHGRVYELFEYIRAAKYDGAKRGAQYAGFTLAKLHCLLLDHEAPYDAPVGTYHNAPSMDQKAALAAEAIIQCEPVVDQKRIRALCGFLHHVYVDAAERVRALGYDHWPSAIVHGDWHPGNLLFEGYKVRAVLDFDSARREPRITDIANGALQFSMEITRPDDPSDWPEGLNAARLRAFFVGYHQHGVQPIAPHEYEAAPWLMIEALIAESITPIAATGRFARIPGSVFLTMIERKVRWIQPRVDKLIELLRARSA